MPVSVILSVQVIVVLVLTIPHYTISSLLAESCRITNGSDGMNPFWLWDNGTATNISLISTAIGDTTSKIKFFDLVTECKENKAIYKVLNVSNIWDPEKHLYIDDFLDYTRVVDNGALNPHDHWYKTFYTAEEKGKIEIGVKNTDLDLLESKEELDTVLPFLDDPQTTKRGFTNLTDENYAYFKERATFARNM
jgi:hypothetical protein